MGGQPAKSRIVTVFLRSLYPVCVFFLLVLPVWGRGKQDSSQPAEGSDSRGGWQQVEGRELWQKEFDISTLKRGKYNFRVRARDAAGNETLDGPYTIMVDPDAGLPVVRIVYPGANAVIRQDTDFLGIADGNFDVERVTVRLDGEDPVQAEGAAYWKFRVETGRIQEGKHSLFAKAWDVKKGEGPELEIPFFYDRTPPLVEFLTIETGMSISGNQKLQGFASDLNGIDRVQFSADGGAGFADLSLVRDRRDPGRVTFTVPFNTTKLPDGQVFFQLRATDATGLSTTQPYLLNVDNEKPFIQILTPRDGEDSLGKTRVTGRVLDAVGLSSFSYEWAGETHNIPVRPGDPYWAIDLFISYQNRKPTVRLTAIDKSNNKTVLEKTFTDKRKGKERTPGVQIDYPTSGLGSLKADQSIYGRIAPGFIPASIIMEGRIEELPARPGFRISPDMIPPGRNTIHLWAKAEDGTLGDRFTLQVNKTSRGDDSVYARLSPIVITSHRDNGFVRGDSAAIVGHIAQLVPRSSGGGLDASALEDLDIDIASALAAGADSGGESQEFEEIPYSVLTERNGAFTLEYRLNPWKDDWMPLNIHRDGSFVVPINLEGIDEGLLHTELRTTQRGLPAIPHYLPLNRATTAPDILFTTPIADGTPVNGTTTVAGQVNSYVPLSKIEYTTDGARYTPIEMQESFRKYEFAFIFDFTALAGTGDIFSVRTTDINGDFFEVPLNVTVNAEADKPVVFFNQFLEGEVVSGDLSISGIVRDDDGVSAVHWRLISVGEDDGLTRDFTRYETPDSFRIDIPLQSLTDGEWRIEAFGEDIYGLQGSVISRTFRVSTADPKVMMASNQDDKIHKRGITYIYGSASDENGIQGVWVSLDNGNTFQQAEGAEEWRIPLNTNFYADGEYALLMRARDNLGRETVDTALITIDNTPPQMDFQAPYNDQKVGNTLDIAAHVIDNVQIQDVIIEVLAVDNSGYRMSFRPDTFGPVILRTLDIEEVPEGEYNLRITAWDPAGNIATASRNITKIAEAADFELGFFNPLPGDTYSGAINISGKTTGRVIPGTVQIVGNGETLADVPVDAQGNFYYQYPGNMIPENGVIVFSARVVTPSQVIISSNEQTLFYRWDGPALSIESHHDGDFITGSTVLTGRAWMELSAARWDAIPRSERKNYGVRRVMVSLDNGQTFRTAKGTESWEFRLDSAEFGQGPLPILVRAEFANGETAIRRVLLTVDPYPPRLRVLSPGRNTLHRNTLSVYGTAGDDYELDSIMIDLRPGAGK